MTVMEFAAVAALGLNITIAVVGATWGLGKIREAMREAVEKLRTQIDADIDALRREVGETTKAIREKVNEVELWGRDHFVKKDTFEVVTDRISKEVSGLGDRIEKRLERMEGKIDAHK